MKKSLLFAAALAACVSVNAQDIEIGTIDASAAGIGSSAAAIAAGTELAKTASVTMTTAFADNYKTVTVNGPKVNDLSLKQVNVGENTNVFGDDTGIQGSANPKAGEDATGMKAPDQGAVVKLDVTQDGLLYIFFKASSNKSYAVYENENLVGHTFVQAAEGALPSVISYTLTGNDEWNYITAKECPVGKIYWPEQYYAGFSLTDTIATKVVGKNAVGAHPANWQKVGVNGIGYVLVKAYQGNSYLFNAFGSKASIRGFVFIPGDPDTVEQPEISVSNDNGDKRVLTEAGGKQPSGISSIKANDAEAINANAPIYNLAGQQVTKAYKGIVIQNGHKFFNVK